MVFKEYILQARLLLKGTELQQDIERGNIEGADSLYDTYDVCNLCQSL
jgi:hypothetical protein